MTSNREQPGPLVVSLLATGALVVGAFVGVVLAVVVGAMLGMAYGLLLGLVSAVSGGWAVLPWAIVWYGTGGAWLGLVFLSLPLALIVGIRQAVGALQPRRPRRPRLPEIVEPHFDSFPCRGRTDFSEPPARK
jgi:hypothetical protein